MRGSRTAAEAGQCRPVETLLFSRWEPSRNYLYRCSGRSVSTVINTILLPTDGSENSQYAINQTIEIARPTEARVHVLSVAPEYGSEQTQDQLRADREEGAETAVVEAKEMLDGAGVETTTAIRDGMTHNKITEYVDDHDIDMIVMGTHGRSGLKRALVGSVAEKTMRNSPIPVVMVPPGEQ